MPQFVKDITFVSGFIVVTFDSGPPRQYPIAAVLRAADIPALTYSQVASIKALANLIVIVVRTLIDRQVLDESFLESNEMDLDTIIYAIEQMGGDYSDPDLSSV